MAIDLYWQGHRVGSVHLPDTSTARTRLKGGVNGWAYADVTRLELSPHLHVRNVAALDEVHYDPMFAELRGITGVRLESPKPGLVPDDADGIFR